jgi:UDP-N-acetylglucosamine 4,6-dehydratase
MFEIFNNKTILVTGGTGSFGKKFIKEILKKSSLKKVIIYSRDEQKQFKLQQEMESNKLRYFIGDVRDKDRLIFAMKLVDIVVHTAALKHVEIAEYNPFEVVKTNILGSQNVIDASLENNVQKVIALSTDKASSPLNLYGASKLTADKLFISANNFKGNAKTIFSVVRYGNVMGSRGSVIPLFLKQKNLNSIYVTDKKMTRFNITLNEGVQFVIKSLNRMRGGEVFVPKIKSYKILDLVKAISTKSKIKIIGKRSGEKIHEEMISAEESHTTVEGNDCYIILPSSKFNKFNKENFLKNSKKFKTVKENFKFSSDKNKFLSFKEIQKLIENNKKDFE